VICYNLRDREIVACFIIFFRFADIAAYPDSVNVLNDVSNDVRTPEKLIDGVNDTMDGRHMWLAPILPNIVRKAFVMKAGLLVSIIAIDSDTIGDTFEVSQSVSAILLCENIDIGIGDTFFGIIAIDYRDTIQYR
jgi:hypothetical protein